MKSSDQPGLNLFTKGKARDTVLKQMLQYLRACSVGRSLQFAYVESETSLIPHLTLWENLHVSTGGNSWQEFLRQAEADWRPLINLIKDPFIKAADATSWERFTVSLINALVSNSPHVLIDMNEESHTELNLQNLKKLLHLLCEKKKVLVATAKPELWVDTAACLISRSGYEFVVQDLNTSPLKTRQSA